MTGKVELHGPARYIFRAAAVLCSSCLGSGLRRAWRGPRRPGWNWTVELSTRVLKRELATAFAMANVMEARKYLDSLVFASPAMSQVSVTAVEDQQVKGSWFVPVNPQPELRLLYFHGGGYSFYPKAHANVHALITLAAQARTFALDYRLTPEHRFPAQLEDALAAYQWLLRSGTDPRQLVVAGDSAGGNLSLGLLLALRERNLPQPALAVVCSPATDFQPPTQLPPGHSSLLDNEPFDWITRDMLLRWANWFCCPEECSNPLVSPVYADLRGLAPIYIQAGQAEILYDSIRAFAERGKQQGADVVLESWPEMNHDFQMFGYLAPQSAQALRRIGEVIHQRVVRA